MRCLKHTHEIPPKHQRLTTTHTHTHTHFTSHEEKKNDRIGIHCWDSLSLGNCGFGANRITAIALFSRTFSLCCSSNRAINALAHSSSALSLSQKKHCKFMFFFLYATLMLSNIACANRHSLSYARCVDCAPSHFTKRKRSRNKNSVCEIPNINFCVFFVSPWLLIRCKRRMHSCPLHPSTAVSQSNFVAIV